MTSFWNSAALEPKRAFKFKVVFGSEAKNDVQHWMVKSIDIPKFEVGEAVHSYLNYEYYYPGKVAWQDITMTLVDPIDPDAARALVEKLTAGGYNPPENAEELQTVSKKRMTEALGSKFSIIQLSAEGKEVARWELHNPWIKNVDFGSHGYESEDLIEISLTLKYDYANYKKGAGKSSIGQGWAAP